ncbi:MAG: SPOR domain-containing protein [Bacteroidales bacterium]|nr:SPOR domain-containing protein [Bacteroidales bacterium]MBP5521475.1 SPOR domain-containing protein [Bacteroidales bacterium]
MKKILLLTLSFLLLSLGLSAQVAKDSTATADIFDMMSGKVTVNQSPEVRSAMAAHIDRNARKAASGQGEQTFRIRIFFDSGQNARAASEAAAARFRSLHPGVSVTRSFTNPFFKVTVGNYATKADAANALKSIQQEFPTAFIVRN